MRNKYLVLAYLLILSLGTIMSLYIPKNEVTAKEAIVIPNEAIRLRILANSDSSEDQALKRLVRDEVNKSITEWVSELTSVEGARTLLQSKLPEIQEIAEQVVLEQGSKQTVKVKFGKVQFPTKLYGQFLYPAGEYEAILITLGEAKGANWWCVLYPPLCFLDFANGVAVSDGFEEEKKQQVAAKKADEEKQVTKQVVSEVQATEMNANEEDEEEVSHSEHVEKVEKKLVVKEKTEKEAKRTTNPRLIDTEEEEKQEPVYVENEEEEVKVKFFVKELWDKLF
ncbi:MULTISPECIES: stage II sporulation protein R [unclassified Bacillus (in: firmicutes)]|uniref:stage II sporulation protein R n=1 Tax=unclassified Bacillus (in: firmicutes) TaxID=185979 RepID=UPI000B83749A|nr:MULTISPECIES: stage II sporulation protein R [unclassified Bacillus (in: firmicutes)]